MGAVRFLRALCHVALPPPAIPRGEPFHMDRAACRCAECCELAVELASVRFSRGMDVRSGSGRSRWDGAKDHVGRSGSHAGEVRQAVPAGARDRDKLTTGMSRNPMFRVEWSLK